MPTEVYIPKAFHRNVVGPSGRNTQFVEGKFKVKISVPLAETSSTLVKIDGADEAGAVAFMEEKIGFKFATTPLESKNFAITADEGNRLLPSLTTLMSKFGCGIRLPKKDGEGATVQGTAAGISGVLAAWHDTLQHDIAEAPASTERPQPYVHKVELDPRAGVIAEALFFGEEGDDREDLNRFIEVIRSADQTLDICVFTITHNRIADAIRREARDGVRVRIISDNHTAEAQGSDVIDLAKAGIPVKLDKSEGHMHHKFAVIDNKVLINGSFNWTTGASTVNYENVMITNEPKFVKAFAKEFEKLWNDNGRFEQI